MAVEQGQYTECLHCGETVDIKTIENMDDEISPTDYCITMTFNPCRKCGFVTVLEYEINNRFSLQSSAEASNALAGKPIWYAQETCKTVIWKEEEE